MQERYRLDELIGKGGAGAVYKGFDTKLQRVVAIKKLLSGKTAAKNDAGSQATAEALWREAKTISALHHPNIVTVFDIGLDRAKKPFVVMELINGENLSEVVSRAALTYEDFLNVATQSLEALNAAHSSGVLHRDIKPGNLMLEWLPTGKYQVKLLDFGLAKMTQAPATQTVDQGGAVLGSINFMAPEQFERKPLDQRTDIYSLGAVLYFSLTAEFPFRGESLSEIMRSHLNSIMTPLAELRTDLPPWLCHWVHWLLRRNPEDRPQSAAIALKELSKQMQLEEQARALAMFDFGAPGKKPSNSAGSQASIWKWLGWSGSTAVALGAASFFWWAEPVSEFFRSGLPVEVPTLPLPPDGEVPVVENGSGVSAGLVKGESANPR